MPKQQLKITDFSGGLNAFADPRDIQDTQFAQNWNASFDKYGVVRFTGAGVRYTTDHPHTNNNFVHGGGLFSFSTDISANVFDGTDLQKGFERGIIGGYSVSADGDDTNESLTLAQTPTFNEQGSHDTNDYYNDMIVHIYDGPGKGQSSLITDYVGSTNVATVTAFGLSDITGSVPDGAASAAGIEGSTSENLAAVGKIRVYAEGSDAYHWGNTVDASTGYGFMANSSFLGSLFPWSAFAVHNANASLFTSGISGCLGFVDWVAAGLNPAGVPENNKRLEIRDRDGKMLTIIFVNAAMALASHPDEFKFPTCVTVSSGADGVDHYDKVNQFQSTRNGNLPGTSIGSWTAGDYIFSSDTNKNYYILNCQNREQGLTGTISDLDGDTSTATATTSSAHNLKSGDRLLVNGTTSYDGIYKITKTGASTFTFPHSSNNDNESGTFATVTKAENITADIADIINAENDDSGINVSAAISFDEDGKRTILTLTAADAGRGTNSSGPSSLDIRYISSGVSNTYHEGNNATILEEFINDYGYDKAVGCGNRDAELEVFQNFTGGLGNPSSASLTKITCSDHSVKVGEYITLRGTFGVSGYDDATFRVEWVEPNAIYIYSTLGDSSTSSCTFTTIPDSSSKYIIYNIGGSGWDFEDSYQGTSLISNKKLSSKTAFLKEIG